MFIDIKKSTKPVKYNDAIQFMEKRVEEVHNNKSNELIWILEHNNIYIFFIKLKVDFFIFYFFY